MNGERWTGCSLLFCYFVNCKSVYNLFECARHFEKSDSFDWSYRLIYSERCVYTSQANFGWEFPSAVFIIFIVFFSSGYICTMRIAKWVGGFFEITKDYQRLLFTFFPSLSILHTTNKRVYNLDDFYIIFWSHFFFGTMWSFFKCGWILWERESGRKKCTRVQTNRKSNILRTISFSTHLYTLQ